MDQGTRPETYTDIRIVEFAEEEPMAFATINYHSRSLEKASSFNIVFPDDPNITRPWSVFYLLHGLSDDHTIWMRRTGHRAVR